MDQVFASSDAGECERAAAAAETEFLLPSGILTAIGRVESRNWPWTANVDGAAEIYRTKQEAVDALRRARSPVPANMDIGCFQISSRYHPAAFASVEQALDPDANARYAARFLIELQQRYGNWERAVGAYHSATPPLEAEYRLQVMAHWRQGVPPVQDASQAPRWQVIAIGADKQPKVAVWSLVSTQMTVWDGKLPRVITLQR